MQIPTSRSLLLGSALAGALWFQGCSDDKPANAEAQQSEGGENAIDEAGNAIDEAHQDFKREVAPAARVVDEKTRAVINEGKKAVKKTGDALDGDDEPEPAAEPKPAETK